MGRSLSLGEQDDLTCGLVSELTVLGARSAGIGSLVGIQNLTSLRRLELNNNSINDISALNGLTRLRFLFFANTSITHISALSGLTSLTSAARVKRAVANLTNPGDLDTFFSPAYSSLGVTKVDAPELIGRSSTLSHREDVKCSSYSVCV